MQTNPSSRTKYKILLAALLLGAMASESVLAQHRHYRGGPRIGLYIGAPLLAYSYYRPYYYPPYYYAPSYYPPVVMAPAPTTYVEQAPVQQYQSVPINPPQQLPSQQYDAAPQQPGAFWYYCADSQAYYPYVKQCPAGWQQVTPQPQS